MLAQKSIFQGVKKTLLSDDKHFPWLLKNDINVAGEDGAVVILPAMGFGKFQGTQYLKKYQFYMNLNWKKKKVSVSCSRLRISPV